MQELDLNKKRKQSSAHKNRRKEKPGKGLSFSSKKKKGSHNKKKGPKIRISKNAVVWIAEITLVIFLAAALVVFFGRRVSNAGDSMSPALENGDVVLVDRLIYDITRPTRGDIIAVRQPGDSHYSLKRVVGLPGETVQITDGKVYINGKVQKKGIYAENITFAGLAEQPMELGTGEYFVLGDNHDVSDDSRMADVGAIQRSEIIGKAWFVVTKGDRFGLVK